MSFFKVVIYKPSVRGLEVFALAFLEKGLPEPLSCISSV
jgi:hypothetical protein